MDDSAFCPQCGSPMRPVRNSLNPWPAVPTVVCDNEWHEPELTPDQSDALAELVHDQASALASHAINGGEGMAFLRRHGWTDEEITERIGLTDGAE